MKAICKERLFKVLNDVPVIFEKGDIVEYTVEDKKFIVKGISLFPAQFFAHFKVTEGANKLEYSDFEYILTNYVFTDAVLFPEEYNGVKHLIIQIPSDDVIMLTTNKSDDLIRVSYSDKKENDYYSDYQSALEGIQKHVKE